MTDKLSKKLKNEFRNFVRNEVKKLMADTYIADDVAHLHVQFVKWDKRNAAVFYRVWDDRYELTPYNTSHCHYEWVELFDAAWSRKSYAWHFWRTVNDILCAARLEEHKREVK